MTRPTLRETLDEYRTGLEAELQLLEQLRDISSDRVDGADTSDETAACSRTADRDRLMDTLLALEETVRPLRETLMKQRDSATRLPGFEAATALHRQAEQLIAEIVEGGQHTLATLEAADRGRRLAREMVDKGRTTLSAYRRVVNPQPVHSSLIRRRG